MRKEDPSPAGSCEPVSIFYVGRNSRGHWIAQDARHSCGGMFVNRAAAMKFAMDETGHRPEAVIPLAHIIELDFGAPARRHIPSSTPLRKAG